MDIQSFAQENPALYQELLHNIQAFIKHHHITSATSLSEWDSMVDSILHEISNEHSAIPAMAHGHSRVGGHSHTHRPPTRPPHCPPRCPSHSPRHPHGSPFRPIFYSDPLRDIARLLFLQELLR